MAERIIPPRLKEGDCLRIIAPAFSASVFKHDLLHSAEATLKSMGLSTTYGKHVNEIDQSRSSSVESRVSDIHEAFEDPDVAGIMTVIGGWSTNQVLQHLDYELIQANPKILCGFSDVDALNNAVQSKTGLVTYSGPHFIFFGQKHHFDYTKDHFEKATMSNAPFDLEPSKQWNDNDWVANPEDRTLIKNSGLQVIQDGSATGNIVGGNLCTLNLLQGTEYMPSLDEVILFIEEAKYSNPFQFDRDLQSLLQQKDFKAKGLVIGRFQPDAITNEQLEFILKSKKELKNIPIIINADFGHTDPKGTIPIGGTAKIEAANEKAVIEFLEH